VNGCGLFLFWRSCGGVEFSGFEAGVKFGVHGLAVALAQTGREPPSGPLTL